MIRVQRVWGGNDSIFISARGVHVQTVTIPRKSMEHALIRNLNAATLNASQFFDGTGASV